VTATYEEAAPAKLNLCLYVGEKRADGLHEIASLFAPLTLADHLSATAATGPDDEVLCPGVEADNLAHRALTAFRERFGWDGPPLKLEIDKKIPIAAGLGGGSADAAATLRIAQRASGISPPAAELRELAMSIGADVPSQLDPRLQIVTGAGELFEPIDHPLAFNALLLTYEDGLPTADVYMHADSMFPPRSGLGQLASNIATGVETAEGDALALMDLLHNDLQGSAVALEPAIGDALDLLRGAGARAALVTGSGPTTFGLFADQARAAKAQQQISAAWPGDVLLATGVS